MPSEFPILPGQPATTPAEPSRPLDQLLPAAATTPATTPQFSKKRLALAFAIAGISDAVGAFLVLSPPMVWAVDIATVILLFTVLGWHWLLLPGLVMEAIPGVGVLPFWLLVVGAIAVWGTARPKLK
jgi:hypothetical protein